MNMNIVLIIDDDLAHTEIIAGHLTNLDQTCKFLIANDGITGYNLAEQHLPGLILVDLMMPELNGLEILEKLQSGKDTREIPVIIMADDSDDEAMLSNTVLSGAFDIIHKPVTRVEMSSRIGALNRYRKIYSLYREQSEISIVKEKTRLEEELFHKEVENQQRQLTINAINILQLSHLQQAVSDELTALMLHVDTDGKKIIRSIISKLLDKSTERVWSEMEVCFERVHIGFYQRLLGQIPELSLRERRLCAFLRLNMTSKEIASITFQSVNAIDVAKHRVKKKIGIKNDGDLCTFLTSL